MSDIRELARRIAGDATGNEQIEVVVASGTGCGILWRIHDLFRIRAEDGSIL